MIQNFHSRDAWADAAADRLAGALADALAADGRALFAGSGGSTPSPIYTRLAQSDLDWTKVTATLVDERYVPEASPDSNAALLKRSLLIGPAATARFIPLYSPAVTVDRAAALASQALTAEGRALDAVLLGMGEDGHICSMFPGSPTLTTLLTPSLKPAVYGVPAGRDGAAPPQERLTLNLSWLAGARRVVLALTGAKKRAVFEREAAGDPAVSPVAALIAANAPLEVLWTEAG
ncbi:6-phosphogluconolactonase, eukaryotic type [Brevundimonas diminuta 3F5N]|uniref:6-phosphogluconolactonase n=1 Tax=Brevundimonas diminuta 3F5N TaxID=1255603 RepID=A0A1R4FZ07_BREDI|nr:6-phosphogluconolactonase [Brevundimonas diminuta]SJM61156.1 6-phosphogluconolactonase, eukaryotic type [Brevundimonas diminuta 3F5N]